MKNEAVASLIVILMAIGGTAGYLVGSSNTRTTTGNSTVMTTEFSHYPNRTTTLTSTVTTVLSQYPITILSMPKGCGLGVFYCVNSTLVNHLGSNLSIFMSAWIRNATTGQNLTAGRNSVVNAECTADARKPSACIVIFSTCCGRTFEATPTALALDSKTVLSPAITAVITD